MSEPIEDTLREAAEVLGIPLAEALPYSTPSEMMLMQANLIKEIAKRIAGIELREPKPTTASPRL